MPRHAKHAPRSDPADEPWEEELPTERELKRRRMLAEVERLDLENHELRVKNELQDLQLARQTATAYEVLDKAGWVDERARLLFRDSIMGALFGAAGLQQPADAHHEGASVSPDEVTVRELLVGCRQECQDRYASDIEAITGVPSLRSVKTPAGTDVVYPESARGELKEAISTYVELNYTCPM
jgi:hypothetical protein